MRPIDADFLESSLEQAADMLLQDGYKAAAELVKILAGDIKYCPTLDVEPVRYGHWVEMEVNESRALLECSVCKNWWMHYGNPPAPATRCPSCAAIMKEGAADATHNRLHD